MFDPENEKAVSELGGALLESRRRLEPFRRVYKMAVEQNVGSWYSTGGPEKPVVLNLMEMAVSVHYRALFPKPPQIAVTTRESRFKPAGWKLQNVVNRRLLDESIQRQLGLSILDSIYGIGLVKIGVNRTSSFRYDAQTGAPETIELVDPYISRILLDDWVHDMSARAFEETQYQGHRYRIPLEEVLADESLDAEGRKKVQVLDGLKGNDGRVSDIQGRGVLPGEYGQQCELWEVWLPQEALVCTFTEDYEILLKCQEYKGPQNGPYRGLWFEEVPGNTMPLAPAMQWQSLHRMANSSLRKLDRQARRAKTVHAVQGADTADAERYRSSGDGDMIASKSQISLQEIKSGMMDQSLFTWVLQLKNFYSWQAGNLDTIGGLSTASDTVGQDKILNANSNQKISAMIDRTRTFLKGVLSDYAYWMWTDPLQRYETEVEIEEYSKEFGKMQTALTPEERQHSIDMHELEIEPYSMISNTPQEKAQILDATIAAAAPFMSMMQEQNLTFDLETYFKLMAQYRNMPELGDLVRSNGMPLTLDRGGDASQMRAPAITRRTNERVSRSAGPAPGNASQIQQFMSAGQQQQQTGAAG